jgi:cell division septation protein DedD
MDRALIERMVGAVVLVLLLIVVAPALLDGRRASDRNIDESAADGHTRTEVIVLNAPLGGREVSQSVSGDEPAKPVVETTAVAVSKSAPVARKEPAPVAKQKVSPRPEPTRQIDGYAVQIGSFGKKGNADQFAAGLSGEGYAVFVMQAKTTTGTVYRVNAGPRATRDGAEKLAAVIRKSGRSVMVVELGSKSNEGSD